MKFYFSDILVKIGGYVIFMKFFELFPLPLPPTLPLSLILYPLCQASSLKIHGVSSIASRIMFSKTGDYVVILDARSRSILQFKCD